MSVKLRIDKYLWSIRAFKTRTLATEACKAGRVKKEGNAIKASYEIKIGDVLTISKGAIKKIIKVTDFLHNRVDAKKAVLYYDDLTPKQDIINFPSSFHSPNLLRDTGTGRPTKKDRREIERLQESWFDDDEE